jgi:Ca2+-binding EF-hand superfamily protein
MKHNSGDEVLQYKESSEFLETSILAAHNKFFRFHVNEQNRIDRDDFVLYNTVIMYFRGNS